MGKIIFTVEGTTVGTVAEGRGIVVAYEVSEHDSARLLSAYADMLNIELTADPASFVEVVKGWSSTVISRATDEVKTHERHKAAETAADSVEPIEVIEKAN